MQVLTLGLNHKTASIDIREQLSFNAEQIPQTLADLIDQTEVQEAILLSTCNRTELYCCVNNDSAAIQPLIDWLANYKHIAVKELQGCLYVHDMHNSIRHLLRVASGLDSMILGEPQILGQIKTAYQIAKKHKTVGLWLDRLFQHGFSVAKQVRTDTEIGSSPVSVAFAAVRLAQQVFGDFKPYTALLIGAGETTELVARHLKEKQMGRMIVANRTLERARHLAVEMDAYAITLQEIPQHLSEVDIVISSTASPEPILDKLAVQTAMQQRKHKPMLLIDIAVPRDIAADVETLEDVYLYSVDDLNDVIQENLRSRAEAAQQAEEIIDTQITHFLDWVQSRSAVDSICDLRNITQKQSHSLRQKAAKMLDKGQSAEKVMDFIIHSLTNQWLHTPCTRLRQAGVNGNQEFIQISRELFGLDD